MRSVERRVRRAEVARTGKVPAGSDIHHLHLRNPRSKYLVRAIQKTLTQIDSGECHPEWGIKRLDALWAMLDSKLKRREERLVRK